MEKKPYPSETQERFIIRFPDGMRDRITEAAKDANRSMNAEIVSRLQLSFDQPMMKILADDMERSDARSGKLQHLTDLVEAQRKAIDAQDINIIMLATHIITLINKLPKPMQDDDDVVEAAEFALSQDIGEKVLAYHGRTGIPLQASSVKILKDGAPSDGIPRLVGGSKAIQAAEKKRVTSKKK